MRCIQIYATAAFFSFLFCLSPSWLFAQDAKEELKQTKKMLNQTFHRNQELSEQNKTYEEKTMKLLNQIVQKDAEIQHLSKKLAMALVSFQEQGLDKASVDKTLDNALQLQTQVLNQQKEIESLQAEKKELEAEVGNLEKTEKMTNLEQMKEDYTKLQKDFDQAKKALEINQKGMVQQYQTIRALQQERDKSIADFEGLMKDIRNIQKQMKGEKASVAAKLNQAEDQISQLKKGVAEKEAQILEVKKESQAQLEKLTKQKDANIEKLRKQNLEYSQALQKSIDMVAQIKGTQTDTEKAVKGIKASHEEEMANLKYQIHQLEDELASAREQMTEKDGEIQKLKNDLATAKNQIAEQDQMLQTKQEQVVDLETLKKKTESVSAGTDKELQQLLRKKEDLIEKMKSRIDELNSLHKKDRLTYFYNLGVVYTTHGLIKEAVDVYKKVLEMDPHDAATHYNLGVLYEEHLHDSKKAKEHFDAYKELTSEGHEFNKSEDWILPDSEGLSSKKKNETSAASFSQDLSKVIWMDSAKEGSKDVPRMKGTQESWTAQLEESNENQLEEIRKLRRKLRIEPSAEKKFNELVRKRKNEIIRLKAKLEALTSQHQAAQAYFYYNLGAVYMMNNYYKEAVGMFEKVLSIDPNDAASHYNLGILYEEHFDNFRKALQHYEAYERLSTDKERFREVEGWIKMMEAEHTDERATQSGSSRQAIKHMFMTTGG